MKQNILVSIIIANFNGRSYLNTCIASVLKSSYKNFELIVIDDGSDDNSVEIVKKFASYDNRVILLKNKKNLGAAASRNKASAKARGSILLFLDNDTQVDKKWIEKILPEFESESQIGAVQSVLLDFKKRALIQNAGARLWAQTGWGLPYFQWKVYQDVKKNLTQEIVAISASLAVRKDVFLFIKGFDEDESVVTEDLDFSWRLWIAGYKIRLARNSVVYHWTKDISMRTNMNHTKKTVYFHLTKNSLTSIIKNYESSNAIYYFLYSILINLTRAFLVLIKKKDAQAIFGTLEAFIWITHNFNKILKKRKFVQTTRKTKDNELFMKILLKSNPLHVYKNHFQQTGLI